MADRKDGGRFAPGHKITRKGAPNRAKANLQAKIDLFIDDNWSQIKKDFKELDPKDRLRAYFDLMKYSIPQKRAVDSNINLNPDASKGEMKAQFMKVLEALMIDE